MIVLTGAEDKVCPPALQDELIQGLPDVDHVILPGVGHMSPLEAPEAVANALVHWLEQSANPPRRHTR